jgi:hypothetical protein
MRRNPGEKGTEKINIIIWQEKEIGNFSKGERFIPPFSVALLYFFRLNLLKISPFFILSHALFLRHGPWMKTDGIVSSILAVLHFPLKTLLANIHRNLFFIYTGIFLQYLFILLHFYWEK